MLACMPEWRSLGCDGHIRRVVQVRRRIKRMPRSLRWRRIIVPPQAVVERETRCQLPGVLGEKRQVVEDRTQFRSVGCIDAGINGNLGLDQGLNVGEIVADVPWAIPVGRSEMTNVGSELEVMPAVGPTQSIHIVELTLVIGGVVSDVIIRRAVIEEEGED